MILALLAFQSFVPDKANTNASVVTTIQKAVTARDVDWNEAPASSRRELVEKLPSGEAYLVRVLDFE